MRRSTLHPRWKEDELLFLKANYLKVSCEETSAKLGRTKSSVKGKARQLGLSKKGSDHWTLSEDEYLKANYGSLSTRAIAKTLERSTLAIRLRAQRLSLCKIKNVESPWTDNEDNFLKSNLGKLKHSEIGLLLGRTTSAVNKRVRTLGLTRTFIKAGHWTKEQVEYLIQHYPTFDTIEIARVLGKKPEHIHSKARRLNVRKEKKDLSPGYRSGKLVVQERLLNYRRETTNTTAWFRCKCDCGQESVVSYSNLTGKHPTQTCGCSQILGPGEASYHILFGRCKMSARARHLPFELTEEDHRTIITSPCVYCNNLGKAFNPYIRSDGKIHGNVKNKDTIEQAWIDVNGVDRINSESGYIRENSVSSCYRCNVAKWEDSPAEFLSQSIRVISHFLDNPERWGLMPGMTRTSELDLQLKEKILGLAGKLNALVACLQKSA